MDGPELTSILYGNSTFRGVKLETLFIIALSISVLHKIQTTFYYELVTVLKQWKS